MEFLSHLVIWLSIYIITACFVFCVLLELISDYEKDDLDFLIAFIWPILLIIVVVILVFGFIYEFIDWLLHHGENS